MKVNIEYTDTFGGEANYCWCKRQTLEMDDNASDLAIVRAAKKAIGINGVKGRTYNHGDMIEVRPFGCNTVMFITFEA